MLLHISRTAYYKWLGEDYGERTRANKQIAEWIEPSIKTIRIKDTEESGTIWTGIMV